MSEEPLRSSRMVERLVNSVSGFAELSKMEENFQLWDLIKEIGNEKGLLSS